MRVSKSLPQHLHAQRRARERFGFAPHVIDDIERTIRSGKSRLVRRVSHRISVHSVRVEGQLVHAVYDRQRHNVVTLLYPGGVSGPTGKAVGVHEAREGIR